MILDDILRHKRSELLAAQRRVALPRLKEAALARPRARPFAAALRPAAAGDPPRLIAEIKKRSPAKGALAPELDVPSTARLFQAAGAAAISVLTDRAFFSGSLDDLRTAREEVNLPVLRKDFLISPYQLFEARAAGADAALLIVAALASPLADSMTLESEAHSTDQAQGDLSAARERLVELLAAARAAGLEALVEVHDASELALAVQAGALVIGINNRDLRTFETRLEITEHLAPRAPAGTLVVSESGIFTAADVRRVRRAGASAILVGSSIVGAPDPAAKIRELTR